MPTHKSWPVFDGHNDTLLQLFRPREGKERTFFERSVHGHIDLPRALEGGFGGGFFAVFVPPAPGTLPGPPETLMVQTEMGYEIPPFPEIEHGYALNTALGMMALLFRIEAESNGALKVVRSAGQLQRCLRRGVVAAVLHLEGAEAIGPELHELEVFYRAGVRSLGLVWSRPNRFAQGVPFKFPHAPDTGPGLSEDGRRLVRACNRLGVLVDLAHLNERGFWEVTELSDAPLVVTHAAAHALCPSTRNLTNEQLDAIAQTDGVVGLNFNVRDLRADGRTELDTPLLETVRHVKYIAHRIGVEHIAFGSDFDGTNVSNELGDVAGLPRLIGALAEAGFDDKELRQITHRNWLRVLKRTWKD